MFFTCLSNASDMRRVMLYKGVPVGIKYTIEQPLWKYITPLQKREFFDHLYDTPYAWTPVDIDRLRGEPFYPRPVSQKKNKTT